ARGPATPPGINRLGAAAPLRGLLAGGGGEDGADAERVQQHVRPVEVAARLDHQRRPRDPLLPRLHQQVEEAAVEHRLLDAGVASLLAGADRLVDDHPLASTLATASCRHADARY